MIHFSELFLRSKDKHGLATLLTHGIPDDLVEHVKVSRLRGTIETYLFKGIR